MALIRSTWLFAILVVAAGSHVKVATWNVAGMEKVSSEELGQQMLSLDADILLTQEDVEFRPPGSSNGIRMEGYRRAGACREEALLDSMAAYAVGGRYLQNAVYVRESTIRVVRSFGQNLSDASPGTAPRCAAFVDFVPSSGPLGRPFRVASLRLGSDGFAASGWRDLAAEKPKQARQVLDWQPDIAAGDLNSYLDAAHVEQAQHSSEPYLQAQSAGDVYEYFGFATGGLEEFLRGGMSRVPADRPTSACGGTTDHVLWRSSARVSWVAGQSSIAGSSNVSDHGALLATFDLVVLPSRSVAVDRLDPRRRLQGEVTGTGRALAADESSSQQAAEAKDERLVTARLIDETEEKINGFLEVVLMSKYTLYFCLLASLCINTVCQFSEVVWQHVVHWKLFITCLIVLHIFYAPVKNPGLLGRYWSKHPVWASLLFVALESVFQFVFQFLHKRITTKLDLTDLRLLTDDSDLSAHNTYRDATIPFRRCFVVFALQFFMLFSFVEALTVSDKSASVDEDANVDMMHASLFRWLLAVGVVYHAKAGDLGQTFNARYWIDLTSALYKKWETEKLGKPDMHFLKIVIRGTMSFIVNSLGLHFMRRTAPVFLCWQAHFDFALNSMGVFFIVSLDDLSDCSATVVDNEKDNNPIGVIPGHKSIDDVVNYLFKEETKQESATSDARDLMEQGGGDGQARAPLFTKEIGRPESAVE